MSEYHTITNLTKRQTLHAHVLGSGLKIYEQMNTGPYYGTMPALALLLASGRWDGDRICVLGDETRNPRFLDRFEETATTYEKEVAALADMIRSREDHITWDVSTTALDLLERYHSVSLTGTGWANPTHISIPTLPASVFSKRNQFIIYCHSTREYITSHGSCSPGLAPDATTREQALATMSWTPPDGIFSWLIALLNTSPWGDAPCSRWAGGRISLFCLQEGNAFPGLKPKAATCIDEELRAYFQKKAGTTYTLAKEGRYPSIAKHGIRQLNLGSMASAMAIAAAIEEANTYREPADPYRIPRTETEIVDNTGKA